MVKNGFLPSRRAVRICRSARGFRAGHDYFSDGTAACHQVPHELQRLPHYCQTDCMRVCTCVRVCVWSACVNASRAGSILTRLRDWSGGASQDFSVRLTRAVRRFIVAITHYQSNRRSADEVTFYLSIRWDFVSEYV